VREGDEARSLAAPEHLAAGETPRLVVVGHLGGDPLDQLMVVDRPARVGCRALVGRPGQDVADEALEDLVYQRPPVDRGDRELPLRDVERLDAEQVPYEVGERARRPRLEACGRHHLVEGRGHGNAREVAVEPCERSASAGPNDARPGDGEGVAFGLPIGPQPVLLLRGGEGRVGDRMGERRDVGDPFSRAVDQLIGRDPLAAERRRRIEEPARGDPITAGP
jgi:hypothetical protein